MKHPFIGRLLALIGISTFLGPAVSAPLEPLPLWPDGAPGALGTDEKDKPTVTAYLPPSEKASGAAMVICPGGGYARLADHEGAGYAEWLAENGVVGVVLKYRLGSDGYRHPAMLQDISRAIRFTRAKAFDWKIDPNRIGVIGSSAGGHLAATILTHFDRGNPEHADPIERHSSRPDLGVLCYAVITMSDATHSGSRSQLLGKNPKSSLVQLLSNEKHVTKETPPCFVWHTSEDASVNPLNSLMFAEALRRNSVPYELHIYQKGAHGMGLGGGRSGGPRHRWIDDCLAWLREQGFVR